MSICLERDVKQWINTARCITKFTESLSSRSKGDRMGIFNRFKSKGTSQNSDNANQNRSKSSISWRPLTRTDQLADILNLSYEQTVLVFKHSTRCIISSMVLRSLESSSEELSTLGAWYYLDLIANRECSNEVAEQFGVVHQSPQLIIIKNGTVVWDASHQAISPEAVLMTER